VAKSANGNGVSVWVRWVLGFIIIALLGIAAGAAANRVGIAENRTCIEKAEETLRRIENKLDRALGLE
jgi:hypothetical protein